MIMSGLPSHLLDDILFRLDVKSLALLRCTNRALHSYVSHPISNPTTSPSSDPISFKEMASISFVRLRVISSSQGTKVNLPNGCRILSSCSGLLLLLQVNTKRLCVSNPITKKFWILDPFSEIEMEKNHCIGFKIDPITQKFKIVLISTSLETTTKRNELTYKFMIHSGDSWRTLKMMITCCSSELMKGMQPVYFESSLHWLRDEGSVIAFNPDTKQAHFIPSIFHKKPDTKLFFTADEKINRCLTLISVTEEEVFVYNLENDSHPEWELASRFKNVSLEKSKLLCWNVAAFDDGIFLAVLESKKDSADGVVHEYDMRAKRWRVLGSTLGSNDGDQELYRFMPSWSSVKRVENPPEMKKQIVKLRPVPLCTSTASIQAVN